MSAMELSFILSAPIDSVAPSSGWSPREESSRRDEHGPAELDAYGRDNTPHADDAPQRPAKLPHRSTGSSVVDSKRQQRVRQLQNLRQRRYRARKKSSASAMLASSTELRQENAELEAAVLACFRAEM